MRNPQACLPSTTTSACKLRQSHGIAKVALGHMELAVKELQDAGIILPQALQSAISKRAVSEL